MTIFGIASFYFQKRRDHKGTNWLHKLFFYIFVQSLVILVSIIETTRHMIITSHRRHGHKVGLFTTKLYAVNIASNCVSSWLLRRTNTLFRMLYSCYNSALYIPYHVIIFLKISRVNMIYIYLYLYPCLCHVCAS